MMLNSDKVGGRGVCYVFTPLVGKYVVEVGYFDRCAPQHVAALGRGGGHPCQCTVCVKYTIIHYEQCTYLSVT